MSESISSIVDDLSQLSISPRRSGKPRLDPTVRLLHRFYEPLVLLKILDPTRGPQNYSPELDTGPDDSRNLWRKFLDQLSWICDSRHGGTTVSAIAAETRPIGPVFWLAANTNPESRVVPHLEWVLNQLVNSHDALPEELDDLERRIVARCVEFSRDRVRTYGRHLCSRVREVAEILAESSNNSDAQLLNDLIKLEQLRFNHLELCSQAYDFRTSTSLQTLSQKHPTGAAPSVWSKLRHSIGRLGSWSKASKIFVRVAKDAPHSIYGFRINCLVPPCPIPAPIPDSQTYLHAALRRMFQKHESKRLQQVQEMLDNFRVLDVSARFEQEYRDKNFKPRVHAELLLLEHFYHQNLRFVNEDRYIGCSKPSCYCCGLYINCHPGRFAIRASHGNLWKSWRAPIPPCVDDEAAQKHTKKILIDMVKHIREDVVLQIDSKAPPRPRVPDSTTGITNVATLPNWTPVENFTSFDKNITWNHFAATTSLEEYVSAQQTSSESTPLNSASSELRLTGSNLLHDEVSTGPQGTTEPKKNSLVHGQGLSEGELESSDDEVVVFRGRGRSHLHHIL